MPCEWGWIRKLQTCDVLVFNSQTNQPQHSTQQRKFKFHTSHQTLSFARNCQHIETANNDSEWFLCEKCGKDYFPFSTLSSHDNRAGTCSSTHMTNDSWGGGKRSLHFHVRTLVNVLVWYKDFKSPRDLENIGKLLSMFVFIFQHLGVLKFTPKATTTNSCKFHPTIFSSM